MNSQSHPGIDAINGCLEQDNMNLMRWNKYGRQFGANPVAACGWVSSNMVVHGHVGVALVGGLVVGSHLSGSGRHVGTLMRHVHRLTCRLSPCQTALTARLINGRAVPWPLPLWC
jgi:hypothetical protein